jgi:hypothetical protein
MSNELEKVTWQKWLQKTYKFGGHYEKRRIKDH